MKVLDKTKCTTVPFHEVANGNVFKLADTERVFVRIMAEYYNAAALDNGEIVFLRNDRPVLSFPNAVLHLNDPA